MPPAPKPKLPSTYKSFITRFPKLGQAHENIAKAVLAAGPLSKKQCELIKIGISLGAGLESALKSHVRRASQSGASKTEIEQAILLAMNTVGFPRTVAAWSWTQQQFARDSPETPAPHQYRDRKGAPTPPRPPQS